MKTIHLTNSWHESSGGIATFYRALIKQANERGHFVRLVVPAEKDATEECGEFGRIYHLQAPRSPFNGKYRTIYPMQFLRPGSQLQAIFAAERPDLVEICDKYTLNYLGALLRKRRLSSVKFRPLVVGLSCERMDDNFRTYVGRIPGAGKFCALYMKWLYFPFFDHHIANSAYTAAELRQAARGHLVTRHTWVRPMGVSLDQLSPSRRSPRGREQLVSKFGAPQQSTLLLYVGRLVPEKNLSLLFETLLKLVADGSRDFRLMVAGDGMERERWESYARDRLPGRVAFLGHVTDPNVLADIYANADLFIHPNPHEPFGIGPLEAMAAGLPLVAPNSGGITSYANGENAWLAEPTIGGFSVAIREALFNHSLRAARARAALDTAREYEWKAVTSLFLDLYADLYRASRTQATPTAVPAFCSTPAQGSQSRWMRAVSVISERTFQLVCKLCFE